MNLSEMRNPMVQPEGDIRFIELADIEGEATPKEEDEFINAILRAS